MWSDEIYEIFEQNQREFTANYEFFLNLVHPEDRLILDKAYRESIEQKKPYDIIHRILLGDGRLKYLREICQTFYDETGKPVRSIGTVQDITERYSVENCLRESEAQFREAQEMARLGSWYFDAHTKQISFSPEVCKIFRIDSIENLTYETMTDYIDPQDRKRNNQLVRRALKCGEAYETDFKIIREMAHPATY